MTGGESIPGFDYDPVGRDTDTTAMMAGGFVAGAAAGAALTYVATYEGTMAATALAAEGLAQVSGGMAITGAVAAGTAKIVGKAQVTPGINGLDHAASSVLQVIEEILRIGPQNVKQVTFNREINTATGGLVKDARRADSVIETTNSCFIVCEITSPTQTTIEMQQKANSMAAGIRSGIGGSTTQTSVKPVTSASGSGLDDFMTYLEYVLGL
jgi:hypothetical protein